MTFGGELPPSLRGVTLPNGQQTRPWATASTLPNSRQKLTLGRGFKHNLEGATQMSSVQDQALSRPRKRQLPGSRWGEGWGVSCSRDPQAKSLAPWFALGRGMGSSLLPRSLAWR